MANNTSSDDEENPLLAALPPATDYIAYLTIIEYNLTPELLPTLHNILKEHVKIAENIGWDLIHILLPLRPASDDCLLDVARFGNPREVILKVTEILEQFRSNQDEGSEEDDEEDGGDDEAGSGKQEGSSKDEDSELDKKIQEFGVLLHLLCILQPRIRTKRPSRFLQTSLQAILLAYETLAHSPKATEPLLLFLRTTISSSRPPLPPRTSSMSVDTYPIGASAMDPEGSTNPSPDEQAVKRGMLQAFLTHVFEIFIKHGPSQGLDWSMMWLECTEPKKIVPHKERYSDKYKNTDEKSKYFVDVDRLAREILVVAKELKMPWDDMYRAIHLGQENVDFGSPEMPISALGALYMIAFKTRDLDDVRIGAHYFAHSQIFERFQSSLDSHAATLDAVLVLGLIYSTEPNMLVECVRPVKEKFSEYLQQLSAISAETLWPGLRYSAHVLTTRVLQSEPDASVRINFITDTIQHCPYPSLQASAVGWLKDEELTGTRLDHEALAQVIFVAQPESDLQDFLLHLPFYMASLNFMYLLLRRTPQIMSRQGDKEGLQLMYEHYLHQLKDSATKYDSAIFEEGAGSSRGFSEDDIQSIKAEIALLADTVKMLEDQINSVAKTTANETD